MSIAKHFCRATKRDDDGENKRRMHEIFVSNPRVTCLSTLKYVVSAAVFRHRCSNVQIITRTGVTISSCSFVFFFFPVVCVRKRHRSELFDNDSDAERGGKWLVPITAQLTIHPATLIARYHTQTHTLTLRNCFVIARNDATQTAARGITRERNIWRRGETRRLSVRGYSRRSLNSRGEHAVVSGNCRWNQIY